MQLYAKIYFELEFREDLKKKYVELALPQAVVGVF